MAIIRQMNPFLKFLFRLPEQALLDIEIVHRTIIKKPGLYWDGDKEKILSFGQQMESEWSKTIEKEISHRLTTKAAQQ